MLDRPKVSYTVTETFNDLVISELHTVSPWFAIADFLLKSREAIKREDVYAFIPLQKTKVIDPSVIFIYQFFCDKKTKPVREISISTKVVATAKNAFNSANTDDKYLCKEYVATTGKIAKHIKNFRMGKLNGTTALLKFATLDDTHPLWVGIISSTESRRLERGEFAMI